MGKEKENHARSHKKEKSVKSDDDRAGWQVFHKPLGPRAPKDAPTGNKHSKERKESHHETRLTESLVRA